MRFKRIKQERRRYPRWMVGGKFAARITPIQEAALIDMSPTGALVEHMDRVQPGTNVFLSISFAEKKMGLNCRVVRSIVHRSQVASNGQRDVIYRTGLEFVGTLQPLSSHGAPSR